MSRHNLPFNVMRDRNSWENAPRDPFTVGNFIIGTVLGTATSSLALIYVTGFVATTLIVSAITRALMPRPPSMQEGLLTNVRQPAAPWDIVYGETRKGGTIVHIESTGDENKYLHMVIALAGHEVEELGDVYINDSVVTIGEDNYVSSEPWVKDGSSEFVYVRKFTGASNQDIYTTLSGLTDGPTFENEAQSNTPSNFKGQGVACLYVRLKYDRDVFASGIPNVTCVVKGKKVYDPRTGVTAYSDNAALCIRDYLVSEYGLNTPESTIDDTYFSTAATDCDTSSGSGEDNRFRIGGVISTDKNLRTNLQDMVGSCVGSLYYSAGKFKLIAGAYSPSVKTLTLDDLRSEISLNTRSSRRDNFNSVQGTFVWGGVDNGSNTAGDWTQTDYPPITSLAFLSEDNEYANPLQLDLPLTNRSATAQRIAKQTLFRAREQMFLSADFGMAAFDLEVGDTVSLTLDRYGFDSKEFEVVGWSFKADQDAGDLRVTLSLKETSSAAYAWDGEETDIIGNNSNLPDANAGLTITNLLIAGGGRTQGDGTFINSAILSWDAAPSSFVAYYDVEWKPLSDSVYSATTTTESTIEVSPLIDGVEYIFRVRAVSVSGISGPYATATFTGGGDETAPALPTDITATGHFEYISINWTNPNDADLNYVEVFENTSNTSIGASKVGISSGDTFQRTNLGLNETKWYFLRSVDYSGNTSAFTDGVFATTTYLDDDAFANGVYSLFTEQGLYAIEDVTSLPPAGDFTGQKLFNRTDGKLYQWTGSAWEALVADVPDGSITETKIANDAITTPKLAANAVTASEILGGTITGDKIQANTITGGLLATSGIITNSAQINNAVIERAKIQDAAISTAKIGNNMVTFPQFATGVSVQNYANPSAEVQIASITVNQSGAPAWIFGESLITHVESAGGGTNSGQYAQFNYILRANGSAISGFNNGLVGALNTPSFVIDTTYTSFGSTTYSLHVQPVGGSAPFLRVLNCSIFYVELKR